MYVGNILFLEYGSWCQVYLWKERPRLFLDPRRFQIVQTHTFSTSSDYQNPWPLSQTPRIAIIDYHPTSDPNES